MDGKRQCDVIYDVGEDSRRGYGIDRYVSRYLPTYLVGEPMKFSIQNASDFVR